MNKKKKDYSCRDCKAPYGPPFVWMTDEEWGLIGCDKEEFICFPCMAKRVVDFSNQNGAWVWCLGIGNNKHDAEKIRKGI